MTNSYPLKRGDDLLNSVNNLIFVIVIREWVIHNRLRQIIPFKTFSAKSPSRAF